MVTTRDALFTRLINALRGVWRGGRDLQIERDTAIETLREISALNAATHDIADRLALSLAELQQLPSSQVERRRKVEQIASRVKSHPATPWYWR